MPGITIEELNRIDAYCEAATPEPWEVNPLYPRKLNFQDGNPSRYVEGPKYVIATTRSTTLDPEFIASARTDLPRLVAAYRSLLDRLATVDQGLNLFRQLVHGKNALRQLGVFACNDEEHTDDGCECFWKQCEQWAKEQSNGK